MNEQTKFTVLVMAAKRPGVVDPIATAQGVSHKCIAPILGRELLLYVLDSLKDSPYVGRIVLSIETPEVIETVPELAQMHKDGVFSTVTSAMNLFASVESAVEQLGDSAWPLIVTTCDNVLQTQEMVDHFCKEMLESGAQASFAMTPSSCVMTDPFYAQFVDQYSFHKMAGDDHSNCNMYALMSPDALHVAGIMKTGGQFRIRPMRVLKAFGPLLLILYKLRLMNLPRISKRMTKKFGIKVKGISMPFPEAPIDVDAPKSYDLAELLLQRKADAANKAS